MYEDREGVRADSQHENVLMEMELAAGSRKSENQAWELPIYRQLERSRGQRSAGRSSALEFAGARAPFPRLPPA
jgi:hypothetical protein